MTLPLDGLNGCRGRDSDEVDAVVSIVNDGGGSVSRLDLDGAFHASYEEIEAMKRCEELEYLDLAFSVCNIIDVNLDRVRGGPSAKGFRQPRISLLGCLRDVGGRQNRNCRGAGRWQKSGD